MLLDKSGMRKKTAKDERQKTSKPKAGGFKQTKRPKTAKEAHDQAVQLALKYGIGYNEYKKEVDSIRAAQIRAKLERAHKK